MAQVQRRVNMADRSVPFAAALATILVAVTIAISAVGVAFMQPDLEPRSAPAGSTVTDGWLPAISAANAAEREALGAGATDGWSVRYLAADTAASAVTDGWAGRYLDGSK